MCGELGSGQFSKFRSYVNRIGFLDHVYVCNLYYFRNMSMVINSRVFSSQGAFSTELLRRLHVGGGGLVRPLLQKEWAAVAKEPKASFVIEFNSDTGDLMGSRWFLSGSLGVTAKVRAQKLWSDTPSKTAFLEFRIPDLENFTFPNRGVWLNISNWMDGEMVGELESVKLIDVKRGINTSDLAVIREEIPSFGDGFSLRLNVTVADTDKAGVFVCATSLSPEKLEEKCRELRKNANGPQVPSIGIPTGPNGALMSIIDVLPMESDEDRVGVLHLPLLESQEGEEDNVTFPDSEALRVECFAFHKKVSLVKRVKEIDWSAHWAQSSIPVVVNWPEYQAPQDVPSEGNNFANSTRRRGHIAKVLSCKVPKAKPDPKYSDKGGFTKESFKGLGGLSDSVCELLAKKSNGSLASSTWRKYGVAQGHLITASRVLNVRFSFPFSASMTLNFIGYLLIRGLQANTIETYLSGIRNAHIVRGVDPHHLKDEIVKCVIKGHENTGRVELPKQVRLPVTIDDLAFFRRNLSKLDMHWRDKILYWTVCTWCFAGSFRIHEILSLKEHEFDPTQTLLHGDIKMSSIYVDGESREVIMVKIKNPKEGKGRSVTVELFENKSFWCPVAAYKKLLLAWGHRPRGTVPFSSGSSGKLLTGRRFNEILHIISYTRGLTLGGVFKSHSFRSGIPSLMARAGYSDQEIKRQGRWRSDSFLRYCKLGRAARWHDQMELADRLARMCVFCVNA